MLESISTGLRKEKGIAFVAHEWGFVACTKCGNVYSYRSAHGTSTLTKHMKKDCAKSSLAKTRSIMEYLGTQKVSGSDKKRIIEAVARMCCTDIRPFNIVSGVGFREFTTVVLKLVSVLSACVTLQSFFLFLTLSGIIFKTMQI